MEKNLPGSAQKSSTQSAETRGKTWTGTQDEHKKRCGRPSWGDWGTWNPPGFQAGPGFRRARTEAWALTGDEALTGDWACTGAWALTGDRALTGGRDWAVAHTGDWNRATELFFLLLGEGGWYSLWISPIFKTGILPSFNRFRFDHSHTDGTWPTWCCGRAWNHYCPDNTLNALVVCAQSRAIYFFMVLPGCVLTWLKVLSVASGGILLCSDENTSQNTPQTSPGCTREPLHFHEQNLTQHAHYILQVSAIAQNEPLPSLVWQFSISEGCVDTKWVWPYRIFSTGGMETAFDFNVVSDDAWSCFLVVVLQCLFSEFLPSLLAPKSSCLALRHLLPRHLNYHVYIQFLV